MYPLARPFLFAADAERIHELTIAGLARWPRSVALLAGCPVQAPVRLMGLTFRNRVGLAAGLDKNGECIEAFDRMGFGFVEIGTVTPRPQAGNPRPRMFRLPRQRAIINRLGFNNHGVEALVARAGRARRQAVLGINIGKNADTPLERAEDDYLACLAAVHQVADYVTVNISSPNTAGLRDLQGSGRFELLLQRLVGARDQLADKHGVRRPLLVKIAPDMEPAQLESIALAARDSGIDGLIATNTTVSRPGLEDAPLASQAGGLSGAPLRPLAEAALGTLRAKLGPDFPLIGVGGILSRADAVRRREAGADLVQIYTGLIYRGPSLVGECARALRG
ncbi:MAG: quinone-dependent dihydroorotate dehydrogenase [Nevskia sp.]|nr:quinone-dependent dihydroorotate dehydrogenase [Nevskia sp.]